MGLRGRSQLKDYHCFFITTTCNKFIPLLEPEEVKTLLFESFRFYGNKYSCKIISYVIMPEHLHFICYFENETQLIEYMRDFKKFTSSQIRKYYEEHPDVLEHLRFKHKTQKFKIWQERFDDLLLYSRKVILTKLNYIHQNPVKAGLAEYAADYKYSSAGFYERKNQPAIEILHVEDIL